MSHRLAEFISVAGRLERERAAARPIVEMVRRNAAAYVGREVPEEWRTAGMVEQLTSAAREMVQQIPAESAVLSTLAAEIAADLDTTYPGVLRSQLLAGALKELANAHRFRSEYESALRAIDRADEALADHPALTYNRAVLALARGTTLRDLERLPEALELVHSATRVFREHGDEGRVAQCSMLVGMIEHRQGKITAARNAYLRTVAVAQQIGDVRTLGSAYINLGVLHAEQGDTNASLDWLQQARAIFRELGAHAEIARAGCGIALALMSAQKYQAAIPVLLDAREALHGLGMVEEAGLAGVEIAEAHLAVGRRDAAQAMIETVIDEFRRANLDQRALVALAYLRDIGPAASPKAARHVRSYLSRLRTEPALLFLPLDE